MIHVLYRESNVGDTNMGSRKTGSDMVLVEVYCVCRHFFKQYFSYVVAASFIGGRNRITRRKPQSCLKSSTSQHAGFEFITLVVITTDYTGSFKSNYHTITATTSPKTGSEKVLTLYDFFIIAFHRCFPPNFGSFG